MPVDEDGIRADLWIDMNSPVGRNNPGQLYEVGINRIAEFVRRKVEVTNEVQGVDAAFAQLNDWYNDVNPNYALHLNETCRTSSDRSGIVQDAIKNSPRIWIPPFLDTLVPDDDNFWKALENIKKWQIKWGARSSRIRYKSLQADGTGKEFISEELFAIGSKYILHLHKIPEIFAPGPASVNHIGIPTKSTYETKHFPVSTNPYRYGEDELRVISMDTNIKEVVRFQNLMSNSPTGVNAAIQAILLSKYPTRIPRIPISNGDLLRTSAVNNLFHSIATDLGVETKNTKLSEEQLARLEEILTDEALIESIWESDPVHLKDKAIDMFGEDETSFKRSSAKRSKIDKMLDNFEEQEIGEPDDSDE